MQHNLDDFVRKVDADDARPSSVLAGMPQWKFGSLASRRLNRAVADWILLDGHHVSALEGEGFKQMVNLFEPRFVPPGRTWMQQVIFVSNDRNATEAFPFLFVIDFVFIVFLIFLFAAFVVFQRLIFLSFIGKAKKSNTPFCMMIVVPILLHFHGLMSKKLSVLPLSCLL
jgi:hypothetical protein